MRLVVLFTLLATPAFAAETVTISTADCRKLVAHAPRADVTYQAGVDVRGKPVVPADLNGGTTLDLPSVIEIPITVDAAKRLGGARAPGDVLGSRRGLEGKAALGALTVKGNDLFWNGQQIQSQDEVLLAESCRSSLRAKGIVLPEAKPQEPK